MNEKKSEKSRSSKQGTVSDSSESTENEKKKRNTNNSSVSETPDDESFHTALGDVHSDDTLERQIDEPISQYFLRTIDDVRPSTTKRISQTEDKESYSNAFRSSISLHNLQTSNFKLTTAGESQKDKGDEEEEQEEEEEDEKESGEEVEEEQEQEEKPIVLSDISRHQTSETERPSFAKISPLATHLSTADFAIEPSVLLKEGVSTIERQDLFDDRLLGSVFRTNLEPGHAFVYMVLPPDGGYGWIVVFVSFLIQTIVDGIIFSIGITLPYMAEDFEVGQSQIIFVSALQVSFYYLSGPITSAIINRFGFRKVAIAGASLSCLSLFIASFSPNLEMMLLFYSALGGPTLSMVWVTSQLIVGYYFEKYRPIANGLSCSGTGAGLVSFVLMNSTLIPLIGWRNNTRIHASFMIIVLCLSFAFLEVAPSKIGIIREPEQVADDGDGTDSSDDEVVKTYIYGQPSSSQDLAADYITLDKIQTQDLEIYKPKKLNRCDQCCRRICKGCYRYRLSYAEGAPSKKSPKRYVIKKDLIERQDLYYNGPAEYNEQDKTMKREIADGQDVELIEEQKPVQAINYVFSMHAPRRSLSEDAKRQKCLAIPNKIKKSFAILFDFKLFRIMEFQILFASAFLFALSFNIPFLFSSARLDLPSHLSSLIPMIIGGATFCSRILCGLVAFKFRTHVIFLCGGAVAFGGSVVFFSAFYGHNLFWFQVVYGILFGIAPAFFSTLRAIIYVQYLGLENLTNTFGLIGMGMGVAVFLGTVIGGVLNDITGDYVASFAFAGACIMGSGTLKLLLSPLSHRRLKARKVKFQV